MNKCWFIWLNSRQDGPFSYEELEANPALTPDTLVWKEGMSTWTPIKKVPELKNLFKDKGQPPKENLNPLKTPVQDEIVLSLDNAEPPFLLWILIAVIILMYVIFRISQ